MNKLRHLLTLSLLAGVACFFLASGSSSAATISPAAGTDGLADDSTCTLSEAITSINDGNNATYDECTNTGDAFGTNDTINLPANPITLTADLPSITESLTIQGQGMDVSVIDGDNGQYAPFRSSSGDLYARDLTVTGALDFAFLVTGGNVRYENIELDGANWGITDPLSAAGGMVTGNQTASADTTVELINVYIHDIDVDVSQFISLGAAAGGVPYTMTVTIENLTISDITNTGVTQGIILGAGLFDNGAGTGTTNSEVSNLTMNRIHSTASAAVGAAAVLLTQGTNTSTTVIRNATVIDVVGTGTTPFLPVGNGVGFAAVGAAITEANVNLVLSNVVVATGGSSSSCIETSLNSVMGSTGAVNTSITSTGGNLSDDSSCASYFDQPTDQNNVSGLAASLSPLADNGGYVPTMALLEDSPAVDAGVTIAGLTTDARLATRPQGNAYDSGAYESPYTRQLVDDGEGLAESGAFIVGVLIVAGVIVGGALLTSRTKPRSKSKPATKRTRK